MHINLYNRRTRNRIAREQRKRLEAMPKINSDTIMRKTLIVQDWNGRELHRVVITVPANKLEKAYLAAYGQAIVDYPRARYFCDASEGVIVNH